MPVPNQVACQQSRQGISCIPINDKTFGSIQMSPAQALMGKQLLHCLD